MQTRVNGVTVRDAYTDQMMYTVGETLSLISHALSLRPGDLLATVHQQASAMPAILLSFCSPETRSRWKWNVWGYCAMRWWAMIAGPQAG